MSSQTSTIVALSTPPGRSAVAVIRLSGPESGQALDSLIASPLPAPRRASVRKLYDPRGGGLLDQALVLWLPGPRTFTGEDMVELHVHGGTAVVDAVLDALLALPGVGPAEPGAFTRRAFACGRMDLTEVEGLADLIAAETAAQRRQALDHLGGRLRRTCETWRGDLIRALAYGEAILDFPDEGLTDAELSDLTNTLAVLRAGIAAVLAEASKGERLRDGVSIALVGRPNVGKSTLLNRLARRDVAIVHAQAGTTRDVLEVALDLSGVPAVLVDTAGLRDSADDVEAEGIRRAQQRAANADIVVVVQDLTHKDQALSFTPKESQTVLVVGNKTDHEAAMPAPGDWIPISAQTGAGLAVLEDRLTALVQNLTGQGDSALITRARHRHALAGCLEAVERAVLRLEADTALVSLDLLVEDLRLAMAALGRLTGRVDVEDLLDIIFRDFCIGK